MKWNEMEIKGCKQRKLRGSGNLIRCGADVLNPSEETRSLCIATPDVTEHCCLHAPAAAASVEAGVVRARKWTGMKHGEGTGQKKEGSMHVEWHLDTKAGIGDFAATSTCRFIRVTCCGTPNLTLHMQWNLANMYPACTGSCNWLLVMSNKTFPQAGTKNNGLPQCGEPCPSVSVMDSALPFGWCVRAEVY